MLNPGEIIIHDENYTEFIDQRVAGETKARGLAPRDWVRHPCGCSPYAPQASIPKIPRSEWSDRIKEMYDSKSMLSNYRDRGAFGSQIPSRDQNGRGYCWAHSTVSAALLVRAKANQPYVSLSAYAIACIIKNYRDEGGWNGESMEFLAERGCPSEEFWPQKSVSRSNDNAKTWENAALNKMTEWDDIPDRDFDTLMTYLFNRCPAPIDLNWWRHSVCACDPVDGAATWGTVRAESGKLVTYQAFNKIWNMDVGAGYGVRIWNSWGDSWSSAGMGILTESKATPDGSIAARVLMAA